MKRMALAGLLVGLLAATAAAQSPYDDDEPMGPGSSEVILKGVRPDSELKPATVIGNSMQDAAKAEDTKAGDMAPMAVCDRCGKDWKDCKCDGHGWTFFGQWLLLQPKGADPVFAVRSSTCTSPPLGSAEQLDFGSESGFKIGIGRALHEPCSEIMATWTHFESNEDHSATIAAPFTLRPLLTHPVLNSCDDGTTVSARADATIDFDRVELDYRRYIDMGCIRAEYAVGFAYGQLNQDLFAEYGDGPVVVDRVEVVTDSFGYGVHVGAGGEYGHGCCRAFGRIDFTVLNADTDARYRQIDAFTGQEALYKEQLDRIMPILDLELGIAVDVTQCMVLKVGYMYSFWFNVVTPADFVDHVHDGSIDGDVHDTLTFDGVFVRLEVTW